MIQIGSILFLFAFFACLICWFLSIVETVGMWRFWPWVFGAGVRVWRERCALPFPKQTDIDSAFETEHGKFKIIAPGVCLFRRKMLLFSFQVHTGFPIKGTLRWNGDDVTIEGRIPLFSMLFFCAFLAVWTIGSIVAIVQRGFFVQRGFLALGAIFLVLVCVSSIYLFSIWLETRGAKKLVSEYAAAAAEFGFPDRP